MTSTAPSKQLKFLIPAAGVLAFLLRLIHNTTAVDEKGLLIAGHWSESFLWLLVAGAAAVLLAWVPKLTGPEAYADAFPPSVCGSIGCVAFAAALLLTPAPQAPTYLFAVAEPLLRFAAVIFLIIVGYCRLTGKRSHFLLLAGICMYFALRLICRYRSWSVDTQLLHYCFQLGAYIAILFTAYQLCAFAAGYGKHASLWGTALSASGMCLAALSDSPEPLLMLCCAFWAWTSLSCLHPKKHPRYSTQHHKN